MEGSETPSNLVSWVSATLVVSYRDPQPKLWSQTACVQIQTEAFWLCNLEQLSFNVLICKMGMTLVLTT